MRPVSGVSAGTEKRHVFFQVESADALLKYSAFNSVDCQPEMEIRAFGSREKEGL